MNSSNLGFKSTFLEAKAPQVDLSSALDGTASNDDGIRQHDENTSIISIPVTIRTECVGWVVCMDGALEGQDFRLTAGRNTIGSAAHCEVV